MEDGEKPHRRQNGPIDVVLPAGGRIAGEFARDAGAEVKALIRLNGQTILARALHALRATGCVGHIAVIGPDAVLAEATRNGADAALPEGATGPENIFRGLEWLRAQNGNTAAQALIATTDLPFLTPEVLHAFLNACPSDADIVVPIVTQETFEARFPGSQNEYVRLRDGQFTLGCAFLVNPQTVLYNRPHIERIFQARKSQWQMARLIGVRTTIRFLTRRLAVQHIVERAGAILNCRGAAVMDAPAELAYDIDLPGEYDYACAHIAGHSDFQEGRMRSAIRIESEKETAR